MPFLNAGGRYLAMTEEPAKRWVQAIGMPF